MGTNYYLHETPCPHCGRAPEPLHIGKSSMGWCFALCVYNDDSHDVHIQSLNDWQAEWSKPGRIIKNEYGDIITPEEMLACITERGGPARTFTRTYRRFDYAGNDAEPGPKNLVRCRIDGRFCVGHGEGTWDLVTPDFS